MALASFWPLVCVAAFLIHSQPSNAAGIGFCLDQIPLPLQGTGYAAKSSLSQTACQQQGHAWCNLDASLQAASVDGVSLDYYSLSPCCTGRQGIQLIADNSGFPTCHANKSWTQCARAEWLEKWYADFLDSGNYDTNAAPVPDIINPITGARTLNTTGCTCVRSPNCTAPLDPQKPCVECKSNQPCLGMPVRFGVQFYKIAHVNLQSSELAFSSWLRLEWNDFRLAYNRQCYGGYHQFEVLAEPGSRENTRIWTPDVELYNSKATIWAGSFPARDAIVYPCPATPNIKPCKRGDASYPCLSQKCGYVYFSRPGTLESLCAFSGLVRFPFDNLACHLEFGAWALHGDDQDLMVGDVDFVRSTGGTNQGIAALVQSAKYQDYRLMNVGSMRYLKRYSAGWYPELLIRVQFKRASGFYVSRLMLPIFFLVLLSWLSFWMHPETGERMGFAVTVILTVLVYDVVASDYVPVTDERYLLELVTTVSFYFTMLVTLETAVVLSMYHQTSKKPNILEWMETAFCCPNLCHSFRARDASHWFGIPHKRSDFAMNDTSRGALKRKLVYRRVFNKLITSRLLRWHLRNSPGFVHVKRVHEFLYFILGTAWDQRKESIDSFISDKHGGTNVLVDFAGFVELCEEFIPEETKDDDKFFGVLTSSWEDVSESDAFVTSAKWHAAAMRIDLRCRFWFPVVYISWMIFLMVLFRGMDADVLVDMVSATKSPLRSRAIQYGYLLILILGLICDLCCVRCTKSRAYMRCGHMLFDSESASRGDDDRDGETGESDDESDPGSKADYYPLTFRFSKQPRDRE